MLTRLIQAAESRSKSRSDILGFSVLELAVVVAVLAILAGISMPAFLNIIKSARIDAAKSQLNSLSSKCLADARDDNFILDSAIDDPSLSVFQANGYNVNPQSNTCSEFEITPADPEDSYSFSMGFSVYKDDKGNITISRFATPSKSSDAFSSCAKWAGTNCTADDALKKKWEDEAKIADLKKKCNEEFYTFLNSGSKGQKNIWDDASQSCSRAQWVLDGTRYTSKDAYDAAFTAKVGKECAATLASYANNNPPNGPYKNEACDIDTYFFNGVNLESSDPTLYESKKLEYNNQQCAAAENSWLKDGKAGQFTWPAGLSCTAKWKCPSENNKVFTDQASYTASTCGTPPKPPCIEPPKEWYCPRFPSRPECQNKCNT